jgi:hypothetical protein
MGSTAGFTKHGYESMIVALGERISWLEAENVRQKATIEAQSAIIKQADEALAARLRKLFGMAERGTK